VNAFDRLVAEVKAGAATGVSELLAREPHLARDAGDHDKTGLHWAAETNQAASAAALLDAGADIEARTDWGAPALHWAGINGHAATVNLLVARGAALTLRDARFDATAEGWAIEGGHEGIAAALRAAAAS
jgi:ankyrin repeat protein